MTTPDDIFAHNRVILTHFDSYSTALLFPRWEGGTLLLPQALPASASPMPAPAEVGPEHSGAAVLQAVFTRYGLNADELSTPTTTANGCKPTMAPSAFTCCASPPLKRQKPPSKPWAAVSNR
jgi:hypothetical protein